MLIVVQGVFTVSSVSTFVYDRVQLFDLVAVNGETVNMTGHIVRIHPNGYFTVQEITSCTPFAATQTVSVF
jgi:hypothetical protein